MSSVSPVSAPTTAATASTATAKAKPKAEDDQHEDGSSIATFCAYQPTALPNSVIAAFNGATATKKSNIDKENKNDMVVDLTEDDDDNISHNKNDDESSHDNDGTDESRTLTLSVPSHTSSACESNLLASVPAPFVKDAATADCLLALISKKDATHTPTALSPLQMEGVLLAILRHRRIFHASGERAGFFLGDGAGIGKGRQISAILRDSLCRSSTTTSTIDCSGHTKRHLWLSVSTELIQDARRDLRDVGVHCDVHDGTTLLDKSNGLGQAEKGILFLTYPLLVSSKRLEQIVQWCAGTHLYNKSKSNPTALAKVADLEANFSGCIIFDEAHKAKNLANDTKTAQLVLQLQRRLPKARVVYCSATGVSDVAHLAYAERLGLWDNTPEAGRRRTASAHNFQNFAAFQTSLDHRGLGNLELLALELKLQGSFMARTLSWEGAEFQTTQIDLTKAQQRVYDRSVVWWNACKANLVTALEMLDPEQREKPGLMWRIFWSAHQRFFKELAICAKIDDLAKDALEQVNKHGRCVVIGLQSTGEAGMQSLLENYSGGNNNNNSGKGSGSKSASVASQFQEERFPELLSTVQAVLTNFVTNNFPVTPMPPTPPKLPTEEPPPFSAPDQERQLYARTQAEIDRLAALPAPEPIPELVKMRRVLLKAVGRLELPPNPLDDLIDRLGGVEHVSEMTGRSGRLIRACSKKDPTQKKDYFCFAKRVSATSGSSCAASQDDSDRINLVERRAFMDGKKSFAIISDAASTGISLHAARGSGGSHKRRVHYTIELPWSADKAVQQLGRTHRSGQSTAPIYKLVVTSLGGERRFAAAVSKRMASLGALTKGDRRAATGSDMLSDFDLDSKYGKRALKRFYMALANNHRLLTDPAGSQYLTSAVLLPSRNAREILDIYAKQMLEDQDPMVLTFPPDDHDDSKKHSIILAVATQELTEIGLDHEARKKADVRVFLNRLAGFTVSKQSMIFSLFMSTLSDVIKEAKSTGEFEGTAEDITATTIAIDSELDLAADPSSGTQSKLTSLILDRGISFDMICNMAVEEGTKKNTVAEPEEEVDVKKEQATAPDVKKEEGDTADDDDDGDSIDDDEWLSKGAVKDNIAPPGFYVSRNRIAGRNFVLFAKHKFNRATFKTSEEAASFDPLGFMQISRPNTGTNMTDMPTSELMKKYRLAFSCKRIQACLDASQETDSKQASALSSLEVIKQSSAEVTDLWGNAYDDSDHYSQQHGLAPRRAEVALVTGPVLHLLPALEKAVVTRSEKDQALKIMRAQVDGRRLVGVRFPSDADAIQNLQSQIALLLSARNDAGNAFTDEALSPVCTKSLDWATTERKTMKSFFKAGAPKSTPSSAKPRSKSVTPTPSNNSKRNVSTSASKFKSSGKKAKNSITSFFAPAKKN